MGRLSASDRIELDNLSNCSLHEVERLSVCRAVYLTARQAIVGRFGRVGELRELRTGVCGNYARVPMPKVCGPARSSYTPIGYQSEIVGQKRRNPPPLTHNHA